MDDCSVSVVDENCCLATWQQVFVILWRNETTLEGAEEVRRQLRKFVALHPAAGLLTIVEKKAPLPPSTVRTRLAEILTSVGASIKRSAVVFEGEGFRAAAVRGVVTGLSMLARPPYPHKVFATVAEAGAWLAPGLIDPAGLPLDATALRESVFRLRDNVSRMAKAG